jgi:hypothetical protein
MSNILAEIFSREFDLSKYVEPKGVNHGKSVEIIEFPCVHRSDQEPVNLILPTLKEGPWIAGGAALRWYQDQSVGDSDIDVFCANEEQAKRTIDYIKSYGRYTVKFDSTNALTLSYWDKDNTRTWTIQVIKRRYFRSLKEVIDNFDISVCQIGTSGNDWLLGKDTARDIRGRNLRMNMPLQPDAAKRLAKYWTYGYRPVDGLLAAVQVNPVAKKIFQSDEDYHNAF